MQMNTISTHGTVIGAARDDGDRRKAVEQQTAFLTKSEVAANQEKTIGATMASDAVDSMTIDLVGLDGRQRQIAAERESPFPGQQETVACFQPDRPLPTFNRQPACTFDDGVELDSIGWRKVYGPVTASVESCKK